MIKHIGKTYSMVEAEQGKYLVEEGKETNAKLIRAIFAGQEIPKFIEKNIEE